MSTAKHKAPKAWQPSSMAFFSLPPNDPYSALLAVCFCLNKGGGSPDQNRGLDLYAAEKGCSLDDATNCNEVACFEGLDEGALLA